MRNVSHHWALLLALPLMVMSCVFLPESEPACPDGHVYVKVNPVVVPSMTKVSLLSDVESRSSGAIVAAYDCETGSLEGVVDVEEGTGLVLMQGRRYDFFLLGNLNYIHRPTGEVCNLRRALGNDFPGFLSEFESFDYRLDGGNVGISSWRRERSSDVASLGIPYSAVRRSLTPEEILSEGGLSFPGCRYLFAKVCLTVDHAGLDHGDASALEWFRNVSLSVRQANLRVWPFSEVPFRAESSSDICGFSGEGLGACFDYDASMVNGTRVQYTLYIPENDQGVLLEGNHDPSRKCPEGLEGAGKGERADLCTFVEFVGSVSPQAGGYGGDVRYRFYLGADAVQDFSVLGGRLYDVTLRLGAQGVFGAEWKVASSLVEHRVLQLFSDAAHTAELTGSDFVSLGIGQPERVYVRCDDGEGRDVFLQSTFTGESWQAGGLDDVGLRCSFWEPGEEDGAWLRSCGVQAVWDLSQRALVFSVVNVEAFALHCGERRTLTVSALPGDGRCCRTFVLSLADCSSGSLMGYELSSPSVYYGDYSVLTVLEETLHLGSGYEMGLRLDDVSLGDFSLPCPSLSLGILTEGVHVLDVELRYGAERECASLLVEVCPVPEVSVWFGLKSLSLTCWKDVRDSAGEPYVVSRLSKGRIWVEFHPQGRFDSVDYLFAGGCGTLSSSSGAVLEVSPVSFGESAFRVVFALGNSLRTVTVPYLVYEPVVFRAVEDHSFLVLLTNSVSVGWQSLESSWVGPLTADVRWSLALTLACADGARVSGSWGPFVDRGASVGDGSRHVRSFHDEFRDLRNSFEQGHRLQDADHLEGTMSFSVNFGSQYYLADVTGATFADFSGVVDAESVTPSAHPLLRHWHDNQSRFYGYRNR